MWGTILVSPETPQGKVRVQEQPMVKGPRDHVQPLGRGLSWDRHRMLDTSKVAETSSWKPERD